MSSTGTAPLSAPISSQAPFLASSVPTAPVAAQQMNMYLAAMFYQQLMAHQQRQIQQMAAFSPLSSPRQQQQLADTSPLDFSRQHQPQQEFTRPPPRLQQQQLQQQPQVPPPSLQYMQAAAAAYASAPVSYTPLTLPTKRTV